MPNQPKTPVRTFRIPEPLWAKVTAEADDTGTNATAVVVKALEARYAD